MADRQSGGEQPNLALTGVTGLDHILGGGLTPNRLYVVEGVPGSGKTTIGLEYLLTGAAMGESTLYVSLSESREELRAVAVSHGWSLDRIEIFEMMPPEQELLPDEQYTIFHPSEVELTRTMKAMLGEVKRLRPRRVVVDSLSELRLLAGNALRYRRQVLALKQFLIGQQCTVLVLDDLSTGEQDLQVHSIAHGVIRLELSASDYGSERRRISIVKFRGREFRGGYHDYLIKKGGLEVFPRLVAAEYRQPRPSGRIESGIPELDDLLGGGLELGTSTLIVGAPGTGKSSLAAQFVSVAAMRGQRAAMFAFDEQTETLLMRADGLGLSLREMVGEGRVHLQQVDPAELTPGEFAAAIRRAVEEDGVSVVAIDSLNGYLNAMPDERFLTAHLHELLTYLGQRGVASLIIGAQQGLIGMNMTSPVDATYLADAVILLRYFEANGEVRQAVSIIKKRGGAHERTIREFRLEPGQIRVGDPLRQFRGVLTGVPTYIGESDPLMENGQA